MPKPADESADTLFEGEWLQIRAITRANGDRPAKEWFDELDDRGQAKFLAAAQVLETTLKSGRPPAGRASPIGKLSKTGLWEMRVTPKGGKPPHLRVLFVRRGRVLWAANGFTKQTNKIERADIQAGDAIVSEAMID